MVKTAEQYSSLISFYEENKSLIEKETGNIVNSKRIEAGEIFRKLGIPSAKVEAYKYTNLQPWFNGDHLHSFLENGFTGRIEDIFKCDIENLESHTVFTVNGKFFPGSNNNGLPQGVYIGSFSEMSKKHPSLTEKYYSKIAPYKEDGMAALNTMLATDGVFIYVPSDVIIEKPIQIVNILTGDKDLMVNQRNYIVLEENAKARVLICDHTLSTSRFLINSISEIQVENSADLDFYNLQNQHNGVVQIGGYYFNQEKESLLNANFFTLNTGVTRNNIIARLGGEFAVNHISGLYLIDKNQHVDNFTFINHASADCESNELFKGVMDDASTGAFTGRILVAKDAQRTNAYQSNNNLLLTELAKINTRPQLEIYADEVKCSHGATVGQLDDNALFYLRARGINKEEANILLMFAFANEVIEKIQLPELKDRIQELVNKRFRGELDKCDSCIVCGQKGNNVFKI